MKNGVKNTLIFLGGAAVGGVAATFALRAFYTKFINETLTAQIDQELDNIKSDYDARITAIKEGYETKIQELKAKIPEEEKKPEPKKETKKTTGGKKKTKEEVQAEATDYTQFAKKGSPKVEDVRAEAIRQIKQEKTNPDNGSYIVSLPEFTEENDYEKITLTYWAKDKKYSNDFDEEDRDAASRIGNLIDKYDDYGDGESLYIRNDELEVDWEIIYNPGSFAEWCAAGN